MMYALILFAHVGMMGQGNSNALTVVNGFTTKQSCMSAGNEASSLTSGTVKEVSFVCVEVK